MEKDPLIAGLLDRINHGDNEDDRNDAFAELCKCYHPMLASEVTFFGIPEADRSRAEGDLYPVLLRAARSYSPEKDASFGTFAKQCVHHALIDMHRGEKKDSMTSDVDTERIAVPNSTEKRLISEENVRSILKEARRRLSDYEYEVLLRMRREYSNPEIAKDLGTTVKSVENAKSRIRTKLAGIELI